MTWLAIIALALAAFLAIGSLMRNVRGGREAVGAVLLVGLAGYGLQGRPDLPGTSKEAAETPSSSSAAMVAARRAISGAGLDSASSWLVIADALASHGQYAEAATVLQGAVSKNPRDGQAWLALANALVAHAQGQLTPAALYAYQHASLAAPEQPGPPFFLGLALANSGRLAEAREIWSRLLAASPADAPWRSDLARRLAQLDSAIAQQAANAP